MRQIVVVTLAAIVAALPSPARACDPVFRSGDQTVDIDATDIAAGSTVTQNFQVRVGDSSPPGGGGGACRVAITVARANVVPDPQFPPYALRAPGNSNIEVLATPSSAGGATNQVPIANPPAGPQGEAVPFKVEIKTQWGLTGGTHIEHLVLSLYDDSGKLTDTIHVDLRIVVPATISLQLIGAISGGPGTAQVDLGELSTTAETRSPPFAALILSTSPYTVSISSVSKGKLVQDGGAATIPYRLYFDGQEVDLAGSNLRSYSQPSLPQGDTRPIAIVVGPADQPAGHYSDRVTVTASAI
jgi:hypothetical protein